VGPTRIIESRDVWLLYPADLRRVARVTVVREFLVELIHKGEQSLGGL
jgi:hypothetical protein